jgi:hypothetical protein
LKVVELSETNKHPTLAKVFFDRQLFSELSASLLPGQRFQIIKKLSCISILIFTMLLIKKLKKPYDTNDETAYKQLHLFRKNTLLTIVKSLRFLEKPCLNCRGIQPLANPFYTLNA